MERLTNPVRERLEKGEVAIGIGIRGLRGVEAARLMKSAGFDWLFIDLEHGPASVETAYQISMAALDAGIAPLVRVPAGELALGARCLDGGALGVVIPHVDTPEQAQAMVDAFRFPPLGHRSIGWAFPASWTMGVCERLSTPCWAHAKSTARSPRLAASTARNCSRGIWTSDFA